MHQSGWWQRALESAIHETNAVDDRIGLARLTILERLVTAASENRNADEDTLFDALDTLRALEWARLSNAGEMASTA
jgi:hypothetical protein